MLSTLFYFLVALLVLVIVHEYGHFQVARWCGVKVLRFSFGFGKVLALWKDKKDTEYALSLFPLGGYVKMLDETEEEVPENEKHLAFNRQSVWAKIAIVLAGPLANFILAFIFLWVAAIIGIQTIAPMIDGITQGSIAAQAGLEKNQEILSLNGEKINTWRDFHYAMMPYIGSDTTINLEVKSLQDGSRKQISLPLDRWKLDSRKPDLLKSMGIQPFVPGIPPIINRVNPDSPGAKAGLEKGDKIKTINNVDVQDWLDLVDYVKTRPSERMQLQILRHDELKTIELISAQKMEEGKIVGVIGLYPEQPQWPAHWLRVEKETPWGALYVAGKQTLQMSVSTINLIGRMITGRLALDGISGPVGIAQTAGSSARAGLEAYLSFLALLSISLGVLNLLPIPLLDGGHLLYYILELVIRKPVSEKVKTVGSYVGILLLGALMVIAFGNDVLRLVPQP